MNIVRGTTSALDGDINVVIDVLRAFAVTHAAFEMGAREVCVIENERDGYALKQKDPSVILVGETNGRKLRCFDFGNSPSRLDGSRIAGRTLVHKTTNGTRAVMSSLGVPLCLVTGLTNALTVSRVISRLACEKPLQVNLIASDEKGDDDFACAEFIRDQVIKGDGDLQSTRARILESETARKFLSEDPDPDFPRRDLLRCIEVWNSNYVMVASRRPGMVVVEKKHERSCQ